MRLRIPLLGLCLLPLLLTACSTVPTAPSAGPREQAAEARFAAGDYRDAALAWQAIADGARGPSRDHAWVRAADAWARAGEPTSARAALDRANRRRLSGDDLLLADMLGAGFLLDEHRPEQALALLGQRPDSIPDSWRGRWHDLRLRALEPRGPSFALAIEYAWRMQDLPVRERSAAARGVERLLAGFDDATLAQGSAGIDAGNPLYPLAARELDRRGLPLPHPLSQAGTVRADDFPPADPDGYRPPRQLAVLLPMTGPLAAAGASVRDGILSGYYAEDRRRPLLRFYDSAGTADGARRAAAQAVADGAQLLLGPLGRDEVAGVLDQGDGPGVNVIALNRSQSLPAGSINFALTPEEEGLAAADRCADRGLLKVWAISQRDDNASRALAAFRAQLQARGGEVVGESVVTESASDFGAALPAQLALADARPQAVYLALKAAPARLVAAQLPGSGLDGLPRLASGLIVSGANVRLDGDLDGIEFPELPWLLDQRPALPDADALARRLPSARGSAQRLFAFGLDAWKLAVYVDRLGHDPGFILRGATGDLRMDSLGSVLRDPAWAVFSGGRPRPAPDRALRPEPPAGR